ncbi:MAG TPA: dihydrodipicolinate synthase family protein [Terriglobales bacterium]|jgi:4-hydroxy-2-oxoglutarate aldolase|nr:dihydrodipicolinate synthase family protein [Terriglobales bacterium]
MLLHGIFPPITTPFYPEGNVYYKKLEANVERYSRTPSAGIVVQGSTGEAILLSDEERREVLKTAIQAAGNRKVMIAGTGVESAIETLRLTEYAATIGYDVAMIRTPHYYKNQMKPENMLAFYRSVADRSPIPIIIYNFPQATGYDIPAELVIQLAEHPNLIGIKESSGNIEKVKKMVDGTRHVQRLATVTETFEAVTPRMLSAREARPQVHELIPVLTLAGEKASTQESSPLEDRAPLTPQPSSSAVTVVGNMKTRQKEVGFQVLVGAAQQLAPSLDAGAVGAILAFACPAPTACYEIYAAWKEGDHALAKEKQERIAKAAPRVVGELGVPGVKYSMDLNGYFGGFPRLPFLPLTAEQKREIEQLMADIRN